MEVNRKYYYLDTSNGQIDEWDAEGYVDECMEGGGTETRVTLKNHEKGKTAVITVSDTFAKLIPTNLQPNDEVLVVCMGRVIGIAEVRECLHDAKKVIIRDTANNREILSSKIAYWGYIESIGTRDYYVYSPLVCRHFGLEYKPKKR